MTSTLADEAWSVMNPRPSHPLILADQATLACHAPVFSRVTSVPNDRRRSRLAPDHDLTVFAKPSIYQALAKTSHSASSRWRPFRHLPLDVRPVLGCSRTSVSAAASAPVRVRIVERRVPNHLIRLELPHRMAAGTHHHRVAVDDDLARIRRSVSVRLYPSPGIVLDVEIVHVATHPVTGMACLPLPWPLATGSLTRGRVDVAFVSHGSAVPSHADCETAINPRSPMSVESARLRTRPEEECPTCSS
jgi:hypothetical protein